MATKAKNLKGYNIHSNDKETVLIEWFDKNPRIITNDDVKAYSLWQMRLPLVVILSTLVYSLSESLLVALLAAVAGYGLATVAYNMAFIQNLTISKRYKPEPKRSFTEYLAAEQPKKKLVSFTIACYLLTVLLIVDTFIQEYEPMYLYALYVIAAGTFVYGTLLVVALTKKNKQN